MMSAPTRTTSAPAARTTTVTVRYFAGAKAAAGTRSEDVTLPEGATVDVLPPFAGG